MTSTAAEKDDLSHADSMKLYKSFSVVWGKIEN